MKTAIMISLRSVLTAIVVTLAIFGCKKNPVGPEVTPNVQLSVDYVTCTEVWLKLGFADSPGGGDYRITRDGATVLTGTISGASAVLYDTTAQAKKTYTYTAYWLSSGQVKQISPPLSVTTLDSTSHNFTWQTFNFGGDAGSCLLRDVSIINDTLVYTVGEVYLKDSIWQTTFSPNNLLTWNGKNWSPSRLYFYTFCGQTHMSSYYADGILPLSPTDVWIGGNGQVTRWNGNSQSDPMCVQTTVEIHRIWGSTSNNVYAGGNHGSMARFDGSAWQQITSGTAFDIQDVWGTVDAATGQSQVLAVACNKFTTDGVAVLRLSGNAANSVQTIGLPLNASSVWSPSGKEWYVCGEDLYRTRSLNSLWQRIGGLGSTYMESMRGNGPNDIFMVGDFGLVKHFNGSTWCDLTQQINIPNSVLYAVAQKGNTVVAVGQYTSGIAGQGVGGAALIVVGKRN